MTDPPTWPPLWPPAVPPLAPGPESRPETHPGTRSETRPLPAPQPGRGLFEPLLEPSPGQDPLPAWGTPPPPSPAGQPYADERYADERYADQVFAGQTYAGQTYAGQTYAGQTYAGQNYADRARPAEAPAVEAPAAEASAAEAHAPEPGAGPAVAPRRSRRGPRQDTGWLRRNAWGLVALPFALALAIGWDVHTVLHLRDAGRPSVSATVPAGQWAASGGIRYRIDSITPMADLTDAYGEAVRIPAGSTLWRARIDVLVPAGVKATGCKARLIDRQGRRFDEDPPGTSSLKVTRCPFDVDPAPGDGAGSSASPSASSASLPSERTVGASMLFLMPADARPAQLWIASTGEVPHYLALTVPATAP